MTAVHVGWGKGFGGKVEAATVMQEAVSMRLQMSARRVAAFCHAGACCHAAAVGSGAHRRA